MDDELVRAGVDRFLDFFQAVRAIHRDLTGVELEEYKPTERQCLEGVFSALFSSRLNGIDFLAELIHRFVWGQCLSNGSHRTSILFVQAFLENAGVAMPRYDAEPESQKRFASDINDWSGRSKALLRRRGEPAYAQASLAPRHLQTARAWLENVLDAQSIVLTTVGPQRLRTFLS